MGKSTTTRTRVTVLESVTTVLSERHREIALLVGLIGCTFAMVSLIGYSPGDPTVLHPGPGSVANPCGPLGALVADVLFGLAGYGAWLSFGGMVATVLALAGRDVFEPTRAVVGSVLLVCLLTMVELLFGPGDAFPPGGMLGQLAGNAMIAVIGQVGAWLVLLGAATVCATILGRIRWGRVSLQVVERVEGLVPPVKATGAKVGSAVGAGVGAAGGAVADQVRASVRGMGQAGWSTLTRMGRSLVRRPDDDGLELEPDAESIAVPSVLERLQGNPDSFAPGTGIGTAVSQDVQLAEVQWQPTGDVGSSELLDLFPVMTPRPSTASGPGTRASQAHERDAPTRPSDDALLAEMLLDTPRSIPTRAEVPEESPVDRVANTAIPLEEDEGDDEQVQRRPVVGAQVRRAAYLDQPVADDGGEVSKKKSTGPWRLPKLSMLDVVPSQHAHFDSDALRELAHKVEETLASFKVTGQVTDVRVGPVVTTFEFLPEKGISVRKVSNLEDDLAMGLCAMSVRIVAPIPGKGVVGIEIPSAQRLNIYLRELLASTVFREAKMALPIVLGKDVEGAPVVADLAKMPHLLVGGTTGAGKSVGVNGMLMSLLFKHSPDELRLLLIDPKKLEFKMYEDIPHLLHPVVTEPKHASAALAWCCREMDARYELLAHWDTRNIAGYNAKVDRERKDWTYEKARRYAPADWPDHKAPPDPARLPYIVIVIDELADLMLVAKKEVEGSIARLTQMARACGIHLIVATQRPSVDVVTGLIKSNLPTRISFKLRTGTDSRTILDSTGAEALLGRGDMLYLPNAGDIARCHGAFVSDAEVSRVVDFIREQAKPDYIEGVTADTTEGGEGLDESDLDDLYDDAVAIVVAANKASTSMIQRHLKIGYNRAARIVDQMEARGVVGPADGARPREVLGQ